MSSSLFNELTMASGQCRPLDLTVNKANLNSKSFVCPILGERLLIRLQQHEQLQRKIIHQIDYQNRYGIDMIIKNNYDKKAANNYYLAASQIRTQLNDIQDQNHLHLQNHNHQQRALIHQYHNPPSPKQEEQPQPEHEAKARAKAKARAQARAQPPQHTQAQLSDQPQLKNTISNHQHVKSKNLRAHLCNKCGRSFSRSDMLTRHSRLHSGLKPYQCNKCHQVFSRSDHLSTHERTHTGEKPFQCKHCSYSACRRDMITRHMRTHTSELAAITRAAQLSGDKCQNEPQQVKQQSSVSLLSLGAQQQQLKQEQPQR